VNRPGVTSRWLLVALLAVAALAGGWAYVRHRRGAGPLPGLTRDARAPEGVRIKVEVLNATSVRGLARRATLHLRDRGFDVVDLGNADSTRDSTLVLDRSGHPAWARLVSDALGGARVETRPDSSRYVDVTVLLGTKWRPPAEPFYP
jgi:LytR cell envelope-related transcriptional attenuator